MNSNAAAIYKRVYLESGSPTHILDALLGRLLADLRQIAVRTTARDFEGKAESVTHALCIINELEGSLDFRSAPALCQNLTSLYNFTRQRILEAHAKCDPSGLESPQKVITTVREAFRGAAETGRR